MKLNNLLKICVITPAMLFSLSACVTALVAAATVATIDIVHDRRSIGEYLDDSAIELKIRNYLLSDSDLRTKTHVNSTSWNGILLLTGELATQKMKRGLVNYTKNIQGVRQLVDETTVAPKAPIQYRNNDTWITTKIKTKLLAKMGLDGNRVKVVTSDSNVYLMGVVSKAEAQRAIDLTRSIKGVRRIVKVFEYQ